MSGELEAPTQDTSTGNQSFSVPNTVSTETTTSDAPQSVNLQDLVPEAYREKPYMQKIKDVDGLFKAFDNAQGLIGKRGLQVPGEDASAEDWDNFYGELGRPKTPDEYDIKVPDDLPEGLTADEGRIGEFKKIAHSLGLNAKQVEGLVKYDIERQKGALSETQEQVKQTQAQLDDEFDKLAAKTFGDNTDQVIENAKRLLNAHAPKSFANDIANLDNRSLVALAAVLDGVTRKYIAEDSPIRGEAVAPPTQSEMLSEARELMQSEKYRNPFHVEHDETKQRVQSIYQKLYG